jgi:hypothetical protein
MAAEGGSGNSIGDGMGLEAKKRAGGGVTAAVGLTVVALAGRSVVSAFDEVGLVDRRVAGLGIGVAVIGAVVTALGARTAVSDWIGSGKQRWVRETAVFLAVTLTAAGAWWFVYVTRPDSEFVEGVLTVEDPFDHRVLISGGNGHLYFITFTPSGSLDAEVQLRGGGQQSVGTLQESGTQVIERVLVGDATWTAVMRHLDGEGGYLLFVDSAEPEQLIFGTEAAARAFEPGRTRAGYTFDVEQRQEVYVGVDAVTDADPAPGLVLRNSGGTTIDNVPAGGDGVIFTVVPKGAYVLEVLGQPAQRYRIVLSDRNPDDPAARPPEPTSGSVAVPDVSRAPEQVAVRQLTEAGFTVQSYAVCSSSLAEEGAPTGTTRQVVQQGTGSASGEEEVVGLEGVVVGTLPASTPLDVKVFNGLPCGAD